MSPVYQRSRLIRQAFTWSVPLALLLSVNGWSQSLSGTIEPIYGPTVTAEIKGIDSDGQLQLGDGSSLPWLAIRRITLNQPSIVPEKKQWQLNLVGGGQLMSDTVVFSGEAIEIRSSLGPLSLPVEQVGQIVNLEWLNASEGKALPEPQLDTDQMVVDVEGQSQTVSGLLESMEANKVLFSFEDEVREVPLDRVRCVVMASAGLVTKDVGVKVTFINGERLFGTPKLWDAASLQLSLAGLQDVKLPLKKIQSLSILSDRQAFVSDAEILAESVTGLVLPPRKWRRDRSVSGGPLSVRRTKGLNDAQPFDKGLGMPSISELSFQATGFDRFVALVGMDFETKGRGDCEIAVLVDGNEVFRQRLRGTDGGIPIDIDLQSGDVLTLRVEAGEELELADHVNWCDARLVKVSAR